MILGHHPTLHDLRYEHGFADWPDEEVAANYPSKRNPDGSIDWFTIHQDDHDREPQPHLSEVE
jgi:hypothetical protein